MFTSLPSEDRGYVILNTDVEVADDLLSMIPYKDLEQESALGILVFLLLVFLIIYYIFIHHFLP